MFADSFRSCPPLSCTFGVTRGQGGWFLFFFYFEAVGNACGAYGVRAITAVLREASAHGGMRRRTSYGLPPPLPGFRAQR